MQEKRDQGRASRPKSLRAYGEHIVDTSAMCCGTVQRHGGLRLICVFDDKPRFSAPCCQARENGRVVQVTGVYTLRPNAAVRLAQMDRIDTIPIKRHDIQKRTFAEACAPPNSVGIEAVAHQVGIGR